MPPQNDNKKLAAVIFGLMIVATVFLGWLHFTDKDGALARQLPEIRHLADFQLTDQSGSPVGNSNLLGKVWVANIIFTRCPGPCPRLTTYMAGLTKRSDLPLSTHFITLTTDPEYDTPKVLQRYAEKHNADLSRWSFLTGPKVDMVKLAVDGLEFIAVEKDPAKRESPEDMFIHSTSFMIIDKRGNLRAKVETDEPKSEEKIVAFVRALTKER